MERTKETIVTLPMGKADLQEAATAVIEQLATAPPDFSQMSDDRVTSYTMGVEVLCECLRSTFKPKVSACFSSCTP